MDRTWIREMAYGCALELERATRVGNPAPVTEAIRSRLDALLPGDWVVEMTVGVYRQSESGVRRLILRRREPVPGQWEDEEDSPSETVWYIETPDGQLARWVNASFLSLPVGAGGGEEARARHLGPSASPRRGLPIR